ncbi:MAG: HDIG domain-containing metalloprotein [Verrucomicrobiota bacterium]
MAFFKKRRKKRLDAENRARLQRRSGDPSKTSQFFESSRLVGGLVFLAFTALVFIICFVGNAPRGPQILEGQLSRIRVVSEFTFSYESALATEKLRKTTEDQVPRVHTLSLEPYRAFADWVKQLESGFQRLDVLLEAADVAEQPSYILAFAESTFTESGFAANAEDVAVILNRVPIEDRSQLFTQALAVMESVFAQGIYEPNTPVFGEDSNIQLFSIIDNTGMTTQVSVLPYTEALFTLRQSLIPISPSVPAARALFGIFKSGLTENLQYDEAATAANVQQALANIQPAKQTVREGDTIITPNQSVSADDFERFQAHQSIKREMMDSGFAFDRHLIERALITIGILCCALLYIRASDKEFIHRNRELGVACLAIALNLLLIRLVIQFGDSALASQSTAISALVQYMLPFALASILVAVLLNQSIALLTTIVVSFLTSIMNGASFDVLFISLFSGLVSIYFTNDARKRSRIVKAGWLAGLGVAICAGFLGILNQLDWNIVLSQIVVASLAGLITGTLVVGLLPLLELIFKFTTEITLLELTDYNHPLLRRMQVEAPGTYHHSLMVANLAERAAAEIGANPLACRACALFHDIGKLVKPDYFVENQRDGINPHGEQTPSMSAIVIKAHVKEGVQMAKRHKLPRTVVDVIRQHHGTSLIQYFYYEAIKKERARNIAQTQMPFVHEVSSVDESTFRYDGPRPRFKESAIIFIADSVEAASRSLKKITPMAIDELIDNIVKDRIDDGQLDECPITMNEIARIKRSFSFTILNMMHSRVVYPKKESIDKENADSKNTSPQASKTSSGSRQPFPNGQPQAT